MNKLSSRKIRLGVNVDHVATVRNARGTAYPSPLVAAQIAEKSGADGITAHLREDRRHITDSDIKALRRGTSLPLNLEMAATSEMLEKALATLPNAVCLVPEKREELTTEGGLDVSLGYDYLKNFVKPLSEKKIKISLFIEADATQIKASRDVGADIIEIHVGKYCDLLERGELQAAQSEFLRYQEMALFAHEIGLEVHVGHGLTYESAKNLSKIEQIEEMNIGHFLIGEAIYYGIGEVIRKMKKSISN